VNEDLPNILRQFSKSTTKDSVFFFLIVLILTMTCSGAYAEEHVPNQPIQYDSSKCSTDAHGMIYFAVGRRVYRQPENVPLGLVAYSDKMREEQHVPSPPKPNEPIGCPDHPIQELGYYIGPFAAMPEDKDKILYANADKVGMEIVNNPKEGLNDESLLDLMCKKYDLRDTTKQGFIGCQKPFKCGNDVIYKAQEYTFPSKKPFLLWCHVGPHCEVGPIYCEAAYKVYGDFNVWYKFVSTTIPVEDTIKLDKELQRRFEAAEVKNYPWPDNKTVNATEK
jgi:hypothetical protein